MNLIQILKNADLSFLVYDSELWTVFTVFILLSTTICKSERITVTTTMILGLMYYDQP
jgi:hypothetical protein